MVLFIFIVILTILLGVVYLVIKLTINFSVATRLFLRIVFTTLIIGMVPIGGEGFALPGPAIVGLPFMYEIYRGEGYFSLMGSWLAPQFLFYCLLFTSVEIYRIRHKN